MSLTGSLKRNSLTKDITRKDVEKPVSKWLIGARDRGGNLAMRAHGGQNMQDINDRDRAQCFFYTLLLIFFIVFAVFIIIV